MFRLRRIWSSVASDSPKEQAGPPLSLGNSEMTRNDLIEELVRALAERKLTCDLGRSKSVNGERTSDALSLCILSVGCIFLVKAAYREYRAFQSMKSQEVSDTKFGASNHSVSMGEFIKYRWFRFIISRLSTN